MNHARLRTQDHGASGERSRGPDTRPLPSRAVPRPGLLLRPDRRQSDLGKLRPGRPVLYVPDARGSEAPACKGEMFEGVNSP